MRTTAARLGGGANTAAASRRSGASARFGASSGMRHWYGSRDASADAATALGLPGASTGLAAPYLRGSYGHAPELQHSAHTGAHPLGEPALSDTLRARAQRIDAAFAAIEPVVRELAVHQFEPGFPAWAARRVQDELGLKLSEHLFHAGWATPLDVRRLVARCVLATFCALVERPFDRALAGIEDGERVDELVQRWGFHAVDITPCADGRLCGVIDYILRVPAAVVAYRRSYAGAMFDVEEALRHWEAVELRRWRDGVPNRPDAASRFLKIGVYHFSSVDPHHEGCAAHGSDTARAAGALLERLDQFVAAVPQTQGDGAAAAALLVGVDTDTDAIRVHVPDSAGAMSIERYVDNLALYDATFGLAREEAKQAVRAAVAQCAGVADDDAATEGMRWFCGYILKNNMGQIDAVRHWHGGNYADRGHTERLIVVGDPVDDVQLRNLAFQAQMQTVEEGAGDLDVGIRILKGLHGPRGLAVPVLVHLRYDPRVPGARERAERRALRLCAAIEARHAALVAAGALVVQPVLRAGDAPELEPLDDRGADEPHPAHESSEAHA